MRDIFIISDTHFGHANFLNFKDVNGDQIRKFASVEEMDTLLFENWNKTVKPHDIVYHLGDVYFGQGWKHISSLNGHKRLILGNHDDGKCQYLQKHFEKIMLWRIFKEHNCVLSHVPLHTSQMEKVYYNLHGHIHQQASPSDRHINCCVEWHDYKPKPIEEFFKDKPDYLTMRSPEYGKY